MSKKENISGRATEVVNSLSAEQAYSVGAAVGTLMKNGLPKGEALNATVTVAEFIRRGQAAQQAVDAILAAERLRGKS